MVENQRSTAPPEYDPLDADAWRESTLRWARERMADAWVHMVAVDATGSHSQSRHDIAARSRWVETTHSNLAASTSIDHFFETVQAALGPLDALGAAESSPGSADFELFSTSAQSKLRDCASMLRINPMGSANWDKVAKSPAASSVAERLKLWTDSIDIPASATEAAFKSAVGVARFATGLSVARAAGFIGREAKLGWMALERASDPEAFVSRQIFEARLKFGFASVSLEGQSQLSADEQSRMLTKGVDAIERAAKFLGVEPKAMGMNGWDLRLINESANAHIFGHLGYINIADSILAIPPSGIDNVHTVVHEWTHMLDLKLGKMAKALAARPDSGLDSITLRKAESASFFSGMPPEVQNLIPLAREGLGNVMGAAQGVRDGAAGFDALAVQRVEASESLARKMALSIAGAADPDRADLAHRQMPAAQAQALHERLQGPIKHLLESRMLDAAVLSPSLVARRAESSPAPSRAWNSQWELLRIDPSSSARAAIEDISDGLDSVLGKSWRTGPDATPASGLPLVAAAIGSALDQSPEEYRRYALMQGTSDFALNPESDFAKASKITEARREDGYHDSQHEMFARAVGRPSSALKRSGTLARLDELTRTGSIASYDELSRMTNTPDLDARAQAQMALGWSQLTEAAGFGPAKLARDMGNTIEAAALSPIGRFVGAILEKWLDSSPHVHAKPVPLPPSPPPPLPRLPAFLDSLPDIESKLLARRKTAKPSGPSSRLLFGPSC